jgi:Zn finger protein HypA/HybF involved in hydrogenase expression
MGDVADMMIDGTLCEGCGVYLEGESHGVPRYCTGCMSNDDVSMINTNTKVNCPKCQRRVKEIGLADHMRDKHGVAKQ